MEAASIPSARARRAISSERAPLIVLGVLLLLLLLGAAWETLLWPFEVCFVGPILFGTAMLLKLEREDRRGDVLACLSLLIAIGFNSLGVAFVAAGAVEVVQRASRGRELLGREWVLAAARRIWIVAIPALLYLLWYAEWGNAATGAVTLESFLTAPRYMVDSLAANLEAVAGLATQQEKSLGWGRPLAVAALALLAYGLWRRPRLHPGVWPPLATLLLCWFLLALNHDLAREPSTSRYLYAGVALFVTVNLLQGVPQRPPASVVAGAIAIFSNLGVLKQGAEYLRVQAVDTKTALGAMDIARP